MSTLRVFISGSYTPETLGSNFAGSLIAALEQAGADVFYRCQIPARETTSIGTDYELYRRPVSILLASHDAEMPIALQKEYRQVQGILSFNPTRTVLSIPIGYSPSENISLPYIPDFLARSRSVTPEQEDRIIAQILDLLALPSLPIVPPATSLLVASDHHGAPQSDELINDRLNSAKTLNIQGRYREASIILRQLTESVPRLAGMWTNLGYTYTLEKQWANGVEACQHAFGEMRERTTSTRCLGTCLIGLGRYEEAYTALLGRTLAVHKSYGAAWLGLGIALVALDRLDEARDAFVRVGSVKPNNPWAYEDEQNVIQAKKHLENM